MYLSLVDRSVKISTGVLAVSGRICLKDSTSAANSRPHISADWSVDDVNAFSRLSANVCMSSR